jgi:hypothetical protein
LSFILRLVLILIVFSFVVYVMKAISRLSFRLRGTMREVSRMRDRMPGQEPVSAEMVRCASCGALFPAAIQFNSEFETGCSATAPSFA